MKSIVIIFLLSLFYTTSFAQQEKRRVIDNFHIDLGLGFGRYTGTQYIPYPKGGGTFGDVQFKYITLPFLRFNYRNHYYKIEFGSRYIVGKEPNDYSQNPLKNKALLEGAVGINILGLIKYEELKYVYFGPTISYQFKYTPYAAFGVGGELVYKNLNFRFSHYNFLEQTLNHHYSPSNERAWFIEMGISFSTKMHWDK